MADDICVHRQAVNVWLVKDGESMPIQSGATKMRTWALGEELSKRGHRLTWWSSTHSHQRKTLVAPTDAVHDISAGFKLRLLDAGSYSRNRSVGRVVHHRRLARRFGDVARSLDAPDIVVVAFPFLELSRTVVEYCAEYDVPVIIDIRDPWPDPLTELLSAPVRGAITPVIRSFERSIGRCLKQADSLVACSEGFLAWGLAHAGRSQRDLDQVFYMGRDRLPLPTQSGSRRDYLAGLGITGDISVLMTFVGSFGHVYDLSTVCDAAEVLWQQGNKEIHFVLAGEGMQYSQVSKRAESLPNVSLTGWLSTNEVTTLLTASDAGLAPCLQPSGTISNKVAEYAAAGLPIISSLTGEMITLLDSWRSGLSFSPSDTGDLVRQLVALTDPELLSDLSVGSSTMFEALFSPSVTHSSYADHVESVARRSEEAGWREHSEKGL